LTLCCDFWGMMSVIMPSHSDEGLMQAIGIVEQGEDLTADVTTADGLYPWACQENNPIGEPLEREDDDDYFCNLWVCRRARRVVRKWIFGTIISWFY